MAVKQAFKLFSIVAVLLIAVSTVQAASVVVGGKGFTEQLLLAEITGQYLTAKGYTVELKTGMGTSLVRKALENKQVDLYWEYTGTAFFKLPQKQVCQSTGGRNLQGGQSRRCENSGSFG